MKGQEQKTTKCLFKYPIIREMETTVRCKKSLQRERFWHSVEFGLFCKILHIKMTNHRQFELIIRYFLKGILPDEIPMERCNFAIGFCCNLLASFQI